MGVGMSNHASCRHPSSPEREQSSKRTKLDLDLDALQAAEQLANLCFTQGKRTGAVSGKCCLRSKAKVSAGFGSVTICDECHGRNYKIPIAATDTGDSLVAKVRAAMDLPATAALELYLSSDGTPIEADATTLAEQGVGDGMALGIRIQPSERAKGKGEKGKKGYVLFHDDKLRISLEELLQNENSIISSIPSISLQNGPHPLASKFASTFTE